MRTLAMDLGGKRVGLALSDAGGTMASPYDVVAAEPAELLSTLRRVVEREGVERLVVGLPLNMDDTAGPAARQTVERATALGRETGLIPIFVDERLSSFDAERQLIDRKRAGEKLTRGKKKKQLDALAAAVFLQAFLDGKLPAIDVHLL